MRFGSDHPAGEWERSERASFRIALAIAFVPIPIALLIAWALNDPPWRPHPPRPAHEGAKELPDRHESP